MNTKLSLLLLALLLFLPAMALCAPAPSTYEDPAWGNLIEKGIGTTLPDSEPLGPGAVSGYHGEGYWPKGFLQIYKPYDLKGHAGLVFSKPALDFGQHYASETVKLFLEATLAMLSEIDQSHHPVIPIQALYYAPTASVPMRNQNEATLAVNLGAFILKDNKSEPLPFAKISERCIQKGAELQFSRAQNAYEHYHRYAESMRPHLNMLRSLAPGDMQQKVNELNKALREEEKAEKKAKKEAQKEAKPPQKVTNHSKKDASFAPIEKRYQDEMSELYAQLQAASGPERQSLAERYVKLDLELENEFEKHKLNQDPNLAQFLQEEHAFYDEIDNKIRTTMTDALACKTSCQKILNKLDNLEAERDQLQATRSAVLRERAKQPGVEKNRSARNIQFNEERRKEHAERMEFNKKYIHQTRQFPPNTHGYLCDFPEAIDIQRTWAMFEAMLTQSTVPVADILMPISLKDDLLSYAISADRPLEILNKFDKIVLTQANTKSNIPEGITVHLMCSVRDRLLGCMLGGDPETEAKVSDVVSQLLKLSENAERSTQFRAIEYAVRANPVDLTYKLNTKALNEATKSMIGSRKSTYTRLLGNFESIPMRGQAASNRKSSKSRAKSKIQDNQDLDI